MLTICVGFLGACAAPKTVIEYKIVSPNIPDQFKTCKQAPEPPGEGSTQADAVTYILGLIEARSDCERKLEAIVRIVK